MERSNRKTYRGTVISDKMDKTITVIVETKKTHPIYGKRVKYSKKFKAHDGLQLNGFFNDFNQTETLCC